MPSPIAPAGRRCASLCETCTGLAGPAIIAEVYTPGTFSHQEKLMSYYIIIPIVLFVGGIALAIWLTNVALIDLHKAQNGKK